MNAEVKTSPTMRYASIIFGYSLLAAGLYWESHGKPGLNVFSGKAEIQTTAATPKAKAVAVRHKKSASAATGKTAKPDHRANTIALLTKGSWKMQSVVSDKPCDTDGDGYETTNILSEMQPCAKDDVLTIRKNGRITYQRGLPCADEPSTQHYDWKLSEDGLFTMTSGSIVAEMYLASVDDQTLKMIIPMEEGGKTYRFTVTYAH